MRLSGYLYQSTFCCNNGMPDAGYFIKKRCLFSSQFWRVKVQDQTGSCVQPLLRAPLAMVTAQRSKKENKCVQYGPSPWGILTLQQPTHRNQPTLPAQHLHLQSGALPLSPGLSDQSPHQFAGDHAFSQRLDLWEAFKPQNCPCLMLADDLKIKTGIVLKSEMSLNIRTSAHSSI